MAVPTPFLAMVVRSWVLPNSKEILGDGVTEMLDGIPFATTRVGLLLPHDVKTKQLTAAHANAAPGTNLRMIPFARLSRWALLENSQSRGWRFFRQLRRARHEFRASLEREMQASVACGESVLTISPVGCYI
jgi:hypothetical protein